MAGKEIGEVSGTDPYKQAKIRCMALLKASDKTEFQLRSRLSEDGYPPEAVEEALEYVRAYHYVDDLRYAKNYIEWRGKLKSRMQLEYELESKGIDRELIAQAFEESQPEDTAEKIRRLAQKKRFDPETADETERRKFYQFLLRKGFLCSDIKKALT